MVNFSGSRKDSLRLRSGSIIGCSASAERRAINLALPTLLNNPRFLPQCDLSLRPSAASGPIGRDSSLEIVDAGNVLHDAVALVIPNIDAERKVLLVTIPVSRVTEPGRVDMLRFPRWNYGRGSAYSRLSEGSRIRESIRVTGIAFECARSALHVFPSDEALSEAVAAKIIERCQKLRDFAIARCHFVAFRARPDSVCVRD